MEFSFAFGSPVFPRPLEGSALRSSAVSRLDAKGAFSLLASGWILFHNHMIAGLSLQGCS